MKLSREYVTIEMKSIEPAVLDGKRNIYRE